MGGGVTDSECHGVVEVAEAMVQPLTRSSWYTGTNHNLVCFIEAVIGHLHQMDLHLLQGGIMEDVSVELGG